MVNQGLLDLKKEIYHIKLETHYKRKEEEDTLYGIPMKVSLFSSLYFPNVK